MAFEKYIMSCVRPRVCQHLWANRLSKRGRCLLIAWWRIVLLPCCLPAHSKIEDKGTERNSMPSHQPLVHTGHLTCLSSEDQITKSCKGGRTAATVPSASELLSIVLCISAGQLGVQRAQLLTNQITPNHLFESGIMISLLWKKSRFRTRGRDLVPLKDLSHGFSVTNRRHNLQWNY